MKLEAIIDKAKKISVVYVFLTIFLLFLGGYSVYHFRNQQIIKVYKLETEQYIEENKEGLKYIYSNLFDHPSTCSDTACYEKEIRAHLRDTIQDFDTMYFIKLAPGNDVEEIRQLDSSGGYGAQTTDWWITNSVYRVSRLLRGKITKPILWKNNLASYDTNGVVIPVKIDDVLLGAIVREIKN